MSEHARVFLAQARTAIEGGNARRAMDLLRRAKLMADRDPLLLTRILDEMTRLAPEVGCESEGEIWSRKLEKLRSRTSPSTPTRDDEELPPDPPDRFSPLTKTVIFTACLAVLLITGGIWFWHWSASRYQPTGARTTEEISRWQRTLHENVGLVLWVQRYENISGDHETTVELPFSSGTAFAVTSDGYMLTNRHVAVPDIQPPQFIDRGSAFPKLLQSGSPFMEVCLGSDRKDHYRVDHPEYVSKAFDLAVLRIRRHFAHPLKLSYRAVSQTEPIIACGFPGAVISQTQEGNPSYRFSKNLKAQVAGAFLYRDSFPPDAFDAVATKGIISTPDKNRENVLYHLIDAKISSGNSGGPLLSQNSGEVIGIVTLGGESFVTKGGALKGGQGYNYALALPQLRAELNRYLP